MGKKKKPGIPPDKGNRNVDVIKDDEINENGKNKNKNKNKNENNINDNIGLVKCLYLSTYVLAPGVPKKARLGNI